MQLNKVRTRFAPSPTGYLHVGGARTALFNWLFARRHGGSFILRIEDTDEARNTLDAHDAILEGMRWLGINWDEGPGVDGGRGPYLQSQRTEIYSNFLSRLEAAGKIYEDDGAIRFRVPDTEICFKDRICGGQKINLTQLGSRTWDTETETEIETNADLIIRRPDGSFLFHFVNVVDDIEMGITHVLRGEDHLSNTAKHIALFEALGAAPPVFAHIPLILNPDGSKMSKRDAGAGLQWYQDEGFLPEAVGNYLALLGWSPKDDREKLTIEEITRLFDFDHLNRSNARFDLEKCTWLNGQHIAALQPEEFLARAQPFAGDAPPAAVALTQPRIQRFTEITEWLAPILNDGHPLEPEAAAKLASKPQTADLLRSLTARLAQSAEWKAEDIKLAITETADEQEVKAGALMLPLRVTATGTSQGTDLMPTLEIIGKQATIARIEHRIAMIFAN
ncbi:MAG: glutamate--tRNA ligase family protein [Verrucomicrobiales bacterium]